MQIRPALSIRLPSLAQRLEIESHCQGSRQSSVDQMLPLEDISLGQAYSRRHSAPNRRTHSRSRDCKFGSAEGHSRGSVAFCIASAICRPSSWACIA